MRTFRDTANREWEVKITVGTVARVLDLTGVDLTKIFDDGSETDRALENVSTMFAVICAVLQPQMNARGVTPEQLGDAMDEEQAEQAALAIYEGVIGFFRGPKRAMLLPAFQRFKAAAMSARDHATTLATKAIESVDFEKVVRAAGNGSRGNSPAPSESTPATEVSVS